MGCGLVDNSPFLRVAHRAHSRDDGWVRFRLSSGYFFNCQGSDETGQVGTFSVVKRVLFQLTNTVDKKAP
jgi:hypothetical protein